LYFNACVFGQHQVTQTPDTLKKESYEYLYDRFLQNKNDTLKAKFYLNIYLNKANDLSDGLGKSLALNMLSNYAINDEEKLTLIKQSIKESNSVDSLFSFSAYNTLGIYYHQRYDYEKAFKNYLKVMRLSLKNGNKNYEVTALNNIAEIKNDIGKNIEALGLYKKCLYIEKGKENQNSIIEISLNLSESFRYAKEYDSASYYYNRVIGKVRQENSYLLNKALINEGINQYYKNEFSQAETLLNEGITYVNLNSKGHKKYYILANYYLGKLSEYYQRKNTEEYFLKVDSLLTTDNIVIPQVQDAYNYLITYYKENNNSQKEVHYLNKLVKFNEIVSTRNINVSNKINSEFDTPELLKNRDTLIKSLQTKNKDLTIEKTSLIIVLLIIISLCILQYQKQKKYKQRFEDVIKEVNRKNVSQKREINKSQVTSLTIDVEIVNNILKRLETFESKKGFLKSTITIRSLAKKISTNTKYLSKVINTHKEKSFINYINDLRIDYILKELQINSTLQRYKIVGVAKEAGFNSADSFSTAFKKKTGISPSYYIKSLKNKKKEKVLTT